MNSFVIRYLVMGIALITISGSYFLWRFLMIGLGPISYLLAPVAGFAIGAVLLAYSKDTENAEKRKQSLVMFIAISMLFLMAVLIRLIFLS